MSYLQGMPELQHVLTAYVFPQLPVHALAAIACSSRVLRDLMYAQAVEHVWKGAAAQYLPSHHPSLQDLDRVDIQQLMQRRLAAVNNLEKGAAIQLAAETGDPPVRSLCQLGQAALLQRISGK